MNAKKKPAAKETGTEATYVLSAEDKSAGENRADRFSKATGLFDFFKDTESAVGFFNFIRTLSGDDVLRLFDAMAKLVRVKEPLSTKTGVLLRVEAALHLAEVYASVTPGEKDDEFVESAKLMLNAGLLPVVADLVASLLKHLKGKDADESSVNAVITGQQSEVLVAQNSVSWSVLIPILVTVLKIIRATVEE